MGNRGPLIEGHHSLTPHFAVLHTFFAKYNTTGECLPGAEQNVDCESLTPTQGATQQTVDCESLTPTQGATQQSMDCESLTPTQGATQQSVD